MNGVPIPKPEKGKPIGKWQKECDALQQEINRLMHTDCEVCGKPMTTGHHFFPKSTSARLRYEFDNLIPICSGCHMQHHQAGNHRIHITIIRKRGKDWYDNLNELSRVKFKTNIAYYRVVKFNLLKMRDEIKTANISSHW